jgi:glycosyltransferase involved in cell wall biosynthesis
MNPRVSVGIAFKDPGAYFPLAIKSVFCQTFQDWELILVDDGSTDGSAAFARSLNDERVRVYSDGMHRNLNVRLNEMVALARAPIFVRMDADDVMLPSRLERQYELLLSMGPNTVLGSGAYSIDANSELQGLRRTRLKQARGFGVRHAFIHPTVAAHTEWFRRNPYSETFIYHRAQDAELWCRTIAFSKFVVTPEPLLFYREDGPLSFERYLGTALGVICLLRREYVDRPLVFLPLLTLELAKLFVYCLPELPALRKLHLRRRWTTVSKSTFEGATSVLARIGESPLPVGRCAGGNAH